MKLTESRNVSTLEDIFDVNGIKLLAKGTGINLGIRERLLYHKLHKPLESSLTVENGIDQAAPQPFSRREKYWGEEKIARGKTCPA